jgi:peptide/nickel transport system permease protein
VWAIELRRAGQGVVVVFLVTLITFLLINLAPGGPAAAMQMDMTASQRQAIIALMHLNEPVTTRYEQWLAGALHGDLGTSLSTEEPVAKLIGQALPNTFDLALAAFVLSVVVGIPMGVVAALRRNSLADRLLSAGSVLGLSVPGFWLAIMMILLFSVTLHWLPSSGTATVGGAFSVGDRAAHLAMPATVLAVSLLPIIVRFTRCTKTTCARPARRAPQA